MSGHEATFPANGMTGCTCGRVFTTSTGWKRHAKAAKAREAREMEGNR